MAERQLRHTGGRVAGVGGPPAAGDDLDTAPFGRVDGLGPMLQLFGYRVDPLLTGLNEALAGGSPPLLTTSLML